MRIWASGPNSHSNFLVLSRGQKLINSWSTSWINVELRFVFPEVDQLLINLLNFGRIQLLINSWSTLVDQLVDQQLINKLNLTEKLINSWPKSWFFRRKVEFSWSTVDQQVEFPTTGNQHVDQLWLEKLNFPQKLISNWAKRLNLGGQSWSTIDQHVEFVEINLLINCWSTCWFLFEKVENWLTVDQRVEFDEKNGKATTKVDQQLINFCFCFLMFLVEFNLLINS